MFTTQHPALPARTRPTGRADTVNVDWVTLGAAKRRLGVVGRAPRAAARALLVATAVGAQYPLCARVVVLCSVF